MHLLKFCIDSFETRLLSLLFTLLLTSELGNGALSPLNNIDTLEPIVRRSPASSDQVSDLFGWAAVLHQIEAATSGDTLTQAVDKTRIIVGAPRGTFPGGLPITDFPNTGTPEDQTGLVYSCPVAPAPCGGVRGNTAVYENDVNAVDNDAAIGNTRITIDNFPQAYVEGRLFDQAPNANLYSSQSQTYSTWENKTGQLLGATLFSSGDQFIACAPRWTSTEGTNTDSQPRGLCYASGRNLQGFQYLRPCAGVGSSSQANDEGYCMAGVSAIPYSDYYVIGAPLADGNGGLYYSSSSNPTTFTAGNRREPNATGNPDSSITDQYQGFVTVKAFITSPRGSSANPPNVVTTVPRYDGNTYTGRVNVYNPPDFATFANLIQTVNAQGSQMAEFFGHSMIAIDLNNDTYDDLVIGAPMNTDYSSLLIERGSIYIFINDGAGVLSTRLILNGTVARGRFGTSLVNLGDINSDGYEDFAVGAPYVPGTGDNTGTVYVYYGSSDPNSLLTQQPFEIRAEDIVGSVNDLNSIKTFGWSLSSGVDVDNNQYNDLVVGAYESQSVILLRTLPVATVTVDILATGPVNLTSNFTVTVRATYNGVGVTGEIRVPFTLSEVMDSTTNNRLTFDNAGNGTFVLSGPNQPNTQTVLVTPLTNVTSLDDYQLQLDLSDIVRTARSDVNGNQSISDLSSFPRLLLDGSTTESVSIINPCGNDGCRSDVMLHPPSANITVTAGGSTVHAVNFFYQHIDGDDAVGLNLTLGNLLSGVITSVAIQRNGSTASETPCSSINSTGYATCILQPRLQIGNNGTIVLNFTIDQNALVGNEESFAVAVEIISRTDNASDMDINTANNVQEVTFEVNAMADLSLSGLSFGGSSFTYTAVAPTQPITSTVDLGQSITLRVDVMNTGVSTVRSGNLTIYLPYRFTGSQYSLLYPTDIQGESSQNGVIQCDSSFTDPEGIGTGSPQVSEGRRKRLAAASRNHRSTLKRVTRQDENRALNCAEDDKETASCTMISCTISNLSPGLFTVSIFTRLDERFFAGKTATYNLTAAANVSVTDNFYGDDPSDNARQETIMLMPMPVVETDDSNRNLLHFILWPCIGGILLLILVAVLLYFVGFFRRKKKPEDDEAEGDFDVDKYQLQGASGGNEKSSPPEPSAPLSSETSKV